MRRSCFVFASPGSSSASPSARAGAAIAQSSVSYSSEMLWPMLPRTAPTARPTNKESTRNEPAPIAIQIQTDTVLYLTRSHPQSLLLLPPTRDRPSLLGVGHARSARHVVRAADRRSRSADPIAVSAGPRARFRRGAGFRYAIRWHLIPYPGAEAPPFAQRLRATWSAIRGERHQTRAMGTSRVSSHARYARFRRKSRCASVALCLPSGLRYGRPSSSPRTRLSPITAAPGARTASGTTSSTR